MVLPTILTLSDKKYKALIQGQTRSSITQKVLADTGNTGRFEPSDATNIFISIGNVLGNGGGNEVVIVIEFDPKNSIAAVYEPNGDQYNYIGNLGDFFCTHKYSPQNLEADNDCLLLFK